MENRELKERRNLGMTAKLGIRVFRLRGEHAPHLFEHVGLGFAKP